MRSWRIPLFTEMRVIKVCKMKCGLWKRRAGCRCIWKSAKQVESSPTLVCEIPVSFCQGKSVGVGGGKEPGSTRTGPRPHPWTGDNFIKPFIDAKYFLLVLPSHLRSWCLLAVQTLRQGICCFLKGFPSPQFWIGLTCYHHHILFP